MSVLLGQPHGFEALARVVVGVPLDGFSFLEAPNDRGEQFDRHGAALDRGFQPGDGDHSLPCLDELLMVDADCLKGREPVREEASDACVTSEAGSSDYVREATDELDFDLGMRRFHEAFDVALVVSATGSLNHVDVLLRHRPRSIAQVAQEEV